MSFVHPVVLLLCILPAGWVLGTWRNSTRRTLLLLKALSLIAVVAALAEPVLSYADRRVAVAVLADTSASVSPEDLRAESATVRAIEGRRRSNYVTLLPFARRTRRLTAEEQSGHLATSKGAEGRATNLEAAIRDGIAALPADAVRRIVLLSDGNENEGTVTRAAWQAQQLGIPIDTYPAAGRTRPGLRIVSVSAPGEVFSGERFPLELTVTAPQATHAEVELEAEGSKLGTQGVELAAGENRVTIRAAVNTVGALEVAGKVSAPGLRSTPFEYALTARRPRVLFVSDDPAGADDHLLRILSSNQFDVERAATLPKDLDGFQLVIHNNEDMQQIPVAEQARLERFEQEGGGLLWIAGEKNIYVDKKGAPEDPLARALPAKLAPPRTPKSKCVILIIDKSSSMEGKKIDLARVAAIGVVDNLQPQDWIAVLIFDNSFQWAVPLRRAEDRSLIKRLISGITPDGGTQIAPALAEAFNKIVPVDAVYKHVVLLTDGISEEGDSLSMAHEAAAAHVTISTVGLGQDVNRSYLEKIAANAGGKSYFLLEPNGLEQILLKDVKEHTGTTAVEKPLKPEVMEKSNLLDGVNMTGAPALEGYVRFEPRPDADEVLKMERDPLLVRWQYGLGRSAVFTSDAKNRWASAWLEWKDFDRFWTNVLRDLLPHAPATEAVTDFDPATGELTVTYRLGRDTKDASEVPAIFALGPEQFREVAKVSKVADGVYRARVSIGSRRGLFRIRPLMESRVFPEVGLYRSEAELTDFGTNEPLLRQLASATGGRYAPTPRDVFDPGGKSTPAVIRLWPGLLGAAIALNFAELLLRKLKGLRQWFPTRAPSPA